MKVCVIGTGRMGRRHIDAAKGLGFDVVGIFDPFKEAMELAVTGNSIPKENCYSDAVEMLNKLKPEGVVIASTAPSHAEHVIAAAKAGVKYIMCEKPMAVSMEECDQMISACKESVSVLGINHQMRFMDQYTEVKALCNTPDFGGILSVNVTSANFGLAMNGCHYFEMFRFITDEEISSVQFWADEQKVPNPRGPQYVDHSGQLRALTKSGKRLYIELGGDQGHGVQVVYGCKFGQIYVDELAGYMRAISRKSEFRDLPTTRYGMPADETIKKITPADVIGPTQSLWKAMLEKHNYPDGAAGRHALAALVAANVSGENQGSLTNIDLQLPHQRVFLWA